MLILFLCYSLTALPSFAARLLGHHHFQEFLVVYEAILVLVDLAYQLVDFFVRHCLVFALQAQPQFLGADRARIIFIEILKGLLYLLLLRIILGVHARRNEFSIVNYAVVIRINHLHRLLNIVHRKLYLWNRLNTFLQFLMSQLAITIFIKFSECCSQILYL